jgi:hypothetical protein
VASCLFLPSAVFGTAIVALRTPDSIFISADALPTYRGTSGPPKVCKIYQADELYFGIAGLEHDTGRNFYPKDIVKMGFSSLDSFRTNLSRIATAMSGQLSAEMIRLKTEDPDTFQFTMLNNGEILSIAFAEIRDGVPYLAALNFQYDESRVPPIIETQLLCPGDGCPTGVLLLYPNHPHVKTYIDGLKGDFRDFAGVTRGIMEIEFAAHPESVGPPVAMMKIGKDSKVAWIANEVGCPVS